MKIIILSKDNTIEAWGILSELCRNHKDFSYGYLKNKKFPFKYKGFSFRKITYRTRLID